VDATFLEERRRRVFFDAARGLGVPGLFLICDAPPDVVRSRLAARRGDVSDADWAVYQQVRERWEAPGSETARNVHWLDTAQLPDAAVDQAVNILRQAELA
jgi:predicted kinase